MECTGTRKKLGSVEAQAPQKKRTQIKWKFMLSKRYESLEKLLLCTVVGGPLLNLTLFFSFVHWRRASLSFNLKCEWSEPFTQNWERKKRAVKSKVMLSAQPTLFSLVVVDDGFCANSFVAHSLDQLKLKRIYVTLGFDSLAPESTMDDDWMIVWLLFYKPLHDQNYSLRISFHPEIDFHRFTACHFLAKL